MRSCLNRLLSLSIVLVFAAVFYSMSACERAYAGKNDDGTTSGSGMDNWNDGGSSHDNGSHDDDSSGHVKKPKKPHKNWFTSGNKYIDPENYFLGTTDAADLVIRTDNVERARITSEGNVGIGTDTPTGILHVEGGRAAGTTDDGTDITIKAQDGGIVSGAGGNIVLEPGSGILTDESGNPVLDDEGNPVPDNGEVIVKGNIAPASDDVNSVGTPELRYKDIYLASNIHYQDDGLFFMFDFWNARDEVWVSLERGVFTWDGKFGIGIHEPTEELHVIGDVLATGNVDAVSYTGDGSNLSGVVTSETDPTVDLAKLKSLVTDDFHNLGGVDADTNTQLSEADVDAFVANNNFSIGAHTVDTDTHLDAAGVTALGFVSGAHMVDTTLDQAGIEALVGTHTVDTDTQLDEAAVDAFVANNNFSIGAHTVDMDTHLDKAGVEALNIDITESQISDLNHTTDTNTQLSEAEVDNFVANNGYLTSETSESDPEVGANTLNRIPKWDGSALVTGTIFDNGNVGIGDTNPTNALKIVDSTKQFTTLQIAAKASGTDHLDGLWIQVNDKTNPDVSIMNRENGTLRFGTNTTDKMVIDATGNVGIGETNPQAKLHIGGTAGVDGIKFPDGTTQTTAATSDNNPTSFFEVYMGGNQGIPKSGAWARINWALKDSDANNEFDLSSDRFTVKVAGKYMLHTMASITSSQTRDSRLQLRKNGSEIANHISSPATNNWASSHSIFMIVNANVGDYFEVYGQQSSGDSGRYAYGAKQYTYFKGYRLP